MEKGTQRTKLNWLNLPEVIVFVICVYSFWASVLILKSLSALGDFNDERILKTQKNPEGWYGEGGGRRVQDGEHMYTCGRFI